MLVMTTIFISKMEGLPPTSDTKMIDYWLILCQLVPFAEVVLITAMEYLREEGYEKKEKVQDCKDTNVGWLGLRKMKTPTAVKGLKMIGEYAVLFCKYIFNLFFIQKRLVCQ